MSQIVRQSNLFAAEDFTKIYKSFQDIDFTAYDFDTIKNSLISYIRAHYPENFNDYVESSEFIAIIELLSYLGTSLAFRTDLNARENILDTAQRRESIIRLARTINYSPSRNLAAHGLMKLDSVSTTQSLVDSDGNNISNIPVFWADSNNDNWFDQFILILNNAFSSINPFGRPTKSKNIGGIPTDIYQFNNSLGLEVAYNVTLNVNGLPVPVDVVNADIDISFQEKNPDQDQPFGIIYRNDSLGVNSNNTGFFFYFRQGTMSFQDNQFNFPVPNRTVEISSENINQSDVFVQEISDSGTVVEQWTKVPAVTGTNIVYNSINFQTRNIYEVISGLSDKVTIKYTDGNFGNIPTGIFRTWYRTSINENIVIRPEHAQGLQISMPYIGKDNQTYILTFKFSLKETVANSSVSETNGQIKLRAPQTYYTQERMVNNQDYNVFPLLYGNQIEKIRSINRTYAGHSRFIDINDPTGFHKDLIVIGEDGAIYQDEEKQRFVYDLEQDSGSISTSDIVLSLKNFTQSSEFESFYYNEYLKEYSALFNTNPFVFSNTFWKTSPDKYENDTGFLQDNNENPILLTNIPYSYVLPGSILSFSNGTTASVNSVQNLGEPSDPDISDIGPIVLIPSVTDGIELKSVIPSFRNNFTEEELSEITNKINERIVFGLGYDVKANRWYIVNNMNLNSNDSFGLSLISGNVDRANKNSWLIYISFNSGDGQNSSTYEFISRGSSIIFESLKSVRFYWDEKQNILDSQTGKSLKDSIEILPKINTNSLGDPLEKSVYWQLSGNFIQNDGFEDPAKIKVIPADLNEDGTLDDPYSFEKIVSDEDFVVFENYTDLDGYQKFRPWLTKWITEFKNRSSVVTIVPDVLNSALEDFYFYSQLGIDGPEIELPVTLGNLIEIKDLSALEVLVDDINFKLQNGTTNVVSNTKILLDELKMKSFKIEKTYYLIKLETIEGFGDNVIYTLDSNHYQKKGKTLTQNLNIANNLRSPFVFKWKHYANSNQRIDPSPSNVIDMTLITNLYYRDMLVWKSENKSVKEMPAAPTTETLRTNFSELDKYKTTSDQIIFTSGKFKILFGYQADKELQATFKVVKIQNSTISDSELKTNIVQMIDEYFNINNWDFGERFFYTELAAYLHSRLSKHLSSVVIVPVKEESEFGNLFEIVARPDELFLSTATVDNIDIVKNYTETNLRM